MERNKKIIRVSFLGIFVNVLLVVFKGIVGFIANSISIILDAVNNLSDAITQVVTIIGAKLSDKKPTKKHPFGFGRIEYISNQIVAAIVIAIGAISLKESIGKIITPSTDTDYNTFAFIIISVSIVVLSISNVQIISAFGSPFGLLSESSSLLSFFKTTKNIITKINTKITKIPPPIKRYLNQFFCFFIDAPLVLWSFKL